MPGQHGTATRDGSPRDFQIVEAAPLDRTIYSFVIANVLVSTMCWPRGSPRALRKHFGSRDFPIFEAAPLDRKKKESVVLAVVLVFNYV